MKCLDADAKSLRLKPYIVAGGNQTREARQKRYSAIGYRQAVRREQSGINTLSAKNPLRLGQAQLQAV